VIVYRVKKLLTSVALGSCLFALSAASCSMISDPSCAGSDAECGNQVLNLGAESDFPLKMVAIS
jgi:hypothetical protein